MHVSEERLKYEIEYQNNFKNTLSEYYRTKTADGTTEFKEYEKWYIYYLDFRWGSIPLSYTSSQANQFWNLYKRVCEDVYKKYHIYEQITYTLLLQISLIRQFQSIFS